jgi:preprotein translocase subunit SecE
MAKSAVAPSYPDASTIGGKVKGFWDRTLGFLRDVRTEMKHVSYPSYKEVRGTTIVVIITVALFGLFFYVVDLIFSRGMDWIFQRFSQ